MYKIEKILNITELNFQMVNLCYENFISIKKKSPVTFEREFLELIGNKLLQLFKAQFHALSSEGNKDIFKI